VHAYETWGFRDLNNELVDILNIWANFVYAPIMEDRTRPIEETNSGQYGRETAGRVQAELRRVGKVEVPREFVFMDRAALGLGSVFLHLKANINWFRIFQELVSGFDVKVLEKRQGEILDKYNLSRPVPGQ
ncbi:MAG: AarF/ABC1/UbiB kinase family protein, partial [Pseudomonadota bacterium]